MTLTAFHSKRRRCKIPLHQNHASHSQNGVVLIIALILLVVISLLASTSMRNAASSESVAGNVRTTELATQAAEIALRHCEALAISLTKLRADAFNTSAEATYSANSATNPATAFAESNILRATTSVQWQSTATWDSTSTAPYVLPSSLVGTATFKRPPECMVESLTGVTPVGTNAAFVITARGFGPEVAAADASRTRPQGTEVWLQSTIEIQ